MRERRDVCFLLLGRDGNSGSDRVGSDKRRWLFAADNAVGLQLVREGAGKGGLGQGTEKNKTS